MADQQSKKKKAVQLDDASTSSSSSIDHDSSLSPVDDPSPTYDPTRIPPSIFSCRQATGADWSINSNESLFSITMGNNSFSRDHAFIVYKSGELLRLDEVFSHPNMPPLAEADNFDPEMRELSVVTGGAAPNKAAPAVKTKTVVDEHGKKKVQKPDDVSSCATSDESDISFAFPILINNKAAAAVVKLPSSHGISTSLKKSLAETQPANAPTSKPTSGLSSWFSCSFSCCPFLRRK